MFLGQPEVALAASERLMEMLPEEVVRFMPEMFESFYGKKIHVMVRFGQWEAILEEPSRRSRPLPLHDRRDAPGPSGSARQPRVP